MFLLHNSEPELAKLVAELEHLQSQGKWDAGLTIITSAGWQNWWLPASRHSTRAATRL